MSTDELNVLEGAQPELAPAASDEAECARFAKRRDARTRGNITHTSLGQPVQVTIRDSSSTGARLELVQTQGAFSPGADRLPTRFILNMPMDRASVECELAWRRGPQMGVRFVTPTRTHAKPVRRRPKEPPPSKLAKLLGFGHVKPL